MIHLSHSFSCFIVTLPMVTLFHSSSSLGEHPSIAIFGRKFSTQNLYPLSKLCYQSMIACHMNRYIILIPNQRIGIIVSTLQLLLVFFRPGSSETTDWRLSMLRFDVGSENKLNFIVPSFGSFSILGHILQVRRHRESKAALLVQLLVLWSAQRRASCRVIILPSLLSSIILRSSMYPYFAPVSSMLTSMPPIDFIGYLYMYMYLYMHMYIYMYLCMNLYLYSPMTFALWPALFFVIFQMSRDADANDIVRIIRLLLERGSLFTIRDIFESVSKRRSKWCSWRLLRWKNIRGMARQR